MSGGVDSSVSAYLVREAGYDVTGATMRLFDNDTIGITDKTCCSLSSIEDACAVANKLGISYVVYDMRQDFRQEVIDRFVSSYERGETPNPCVACNKYLKFDRLYELSAADLLREEDGCVQSGNDVDRNFPPLSIATGHYATNVVRNGKMWLGTAKDPVKDQTDFLAQLSYEQLSHTLFPIGHLMKDEVRQIALDAKLPSARRKDSQGICFLGKINYNDFIRRFMGEQEGRL